MKSESIAAGPLPSLPDITPAMYQFYQIMICLLKFDFFCFIGVTSQVYCFITIGCGHR